MSHTALTGSVELEAASRPAAPKSPSRRDFYRKGDVLDRSQVLWDPRGIVRRQRIATLEHQLTPLWLSSTPLGVASLAVLNKVYLSKYLP